jgi:hypothetical protein
MNPFTVLYGAFRPLGGDGLRVRQVAARRRVRDAARCAWCVGVASLGSVRARSSAAGSLVFEGLLWGMLHAKQHYRAGGNVVMRGVS